MIPFSLIEAQIRMIVARAEGSDVSGFKALSKTLRAGQQQPVEICKDLLEGAHAVLLHSVNKHCGFK